MTTSKSKSVGAGEPIGRASRRFRRAAQLHDRARARCPGSSTRFPALAALAAMMPPGAELDRPRRRRAARQGKRPHLGAGRGSARAGASTSRSSRTASTFAARPLRGGDGRTPPAITGWRWRSPIAATRRRRPVDDHRAPTRSTSRIRGSSTTLGRLTRGDARQDLSRRVHGGGQDDRRPRPGGDGLAGGPRTSTS